jgi:hypothetical protein
MVFFFPQPSEKGIFANFVESWKIYAIPGRKLIRSNTTTPRDHRYKFFHFALLLFSSGCAENILTLIQNVEEGSFVYFMFAVLLSYCKLLHSK